jgi:hypothetical protein
VADLLRLLDRRFPELNAEETKSMSNTTRIISAYHPLLYPLKRSSPHQT